MSQAKPRFLLAANLNRLAKWLRLLGYDAAIYRSISFHNMKRLAAKERRKILTRSQKQQDKKNKDIILIKSEEHLEQLKEIREMLTINDQLLFSRCLICNKLLYEITRENIRELVPAHVYNAHREFKICRKCGRIYWQGSHYKKMLDTLKEIFDSEIGE